jgi:cellulose synthase/poly-beta-1,6-N-acetylglucosamine synthase-like glycosyltransferase
MLLEESLKVLFALFELTEQPFVFAAKLMPFVLFLEIPLYLIIWLGIFRYSLRQRFSVMSDPPYYPTVSCIVTCYSEGESVKLTILTLLEQVYPGKIELNVVLDGAVQNVETFRAIKEMEPVVARYSNRTMRLIAKKQRGGRVSSANAGLSFSTGEIIMALDGDTSFDNDMVAKIVRHFYDENVVASSGVLKVRNVSSSFVTRLQSMEYKQAIHASKLGLAEWEAINNISGAFGVFRKSFLEKIGGWNTGTAEDLDLTIRIKQYLGRYPHLRIAFEPDAVAHTDVPETWKAFFQQRFRWDGDLSYIYFRKHFLAFTPSLIGWRNFIFVLWSGVLFQVVMPFLIVLFTIFIYMTQPMATIIGTTMLIYLFYFLLITAQFFLFIVLLSDNLIEDLKLLWLLPFFPLFAFSIRVWATVANLNELINKGHLDSGMAPWWVLKKDKF